MVNKRAGELRERERENRGITFLSMSKIGFDKVINCDDFTYPFHKVARH